MTRKFAALAFVLLFFLSYYAVGVGGRAQGSKAQGEAAQKAVDDDLAKLAKAQRDAAEKAYKAWFELGTSGRGNTVTLYHLSIPWLNAELDLAKKKEERLAAYTAHLHRMNDWEKEWKRVGAGPEEQMLLVIATFQRQAEYWLAKERSTKK